MDILIGKQQDDAGRVVMELFADVVPRTAENFRQLITGEFKINGKPSGYKESIFHRKIKGQIIQGGDFIKGDGTGQMSIYGPRFEDETFQIPHDRAGLLSMANSGPNSNGCQFFITLCPLPSLNGQNVVFGRVLDGYSVLTRMDTVSTNAVDDTPKLRITIKECGEL
ncbi:hypothetical protein MP228_008113 [Amoeboaphelidium protococcarum]|nr:hypothetical protein MP228_008113 [Amoeboaphelidium protococcarum]